MSDQLVKNARHVAEQLRWDRWRDRKTGEYTDKYDTSSVEAERREAADLIDQLVAKIESLT